jgi:hypothetical protein
MILDVGLSELYRGKANVWVEDAITRTYLKECWSDDPDVLFLIAGGNEHVWAILKHAEEHGYTNVFGIADRDFRESNHPHWFNLAKNFRCFVPTVHEVENFLLDAPALTGSVTNTDGRTLQQIDDRLKARAGQLAWWMACRTVIMQIRAEFREGFLEHPKCPHVTDLPTAEKCILTHPWYQQLAARTATITTAGVITARLNTAHAATTTQLADGSWRHEFSGKELFRDVRGWVYTKPPAPASPSELDADVARAVAQWQVANGAVPMEIVELRQAIRQRAGLP